MHKLRRFFGWQLASELSSAKFAQATCYFRALGFFALAIWKIARLKLTEQALFFGILHVLTVLMLIICVGTLVSIHAELTKKDNIR